MIETEPVIMLLKFCHLSAQEPNLKIGYVT